MANAKLIRRAILPIEPVREHKVEGEPYRAARAGFTGDPGEVQVTMTVDEAYKVQTILGCGVCNSGLIALPSNVWMALEQALGRTPYTMKAGGVNGAGRYGWPYLVKR